MCPQHITAARFNQAFGILQEFGVTPRHQMMVKCGDWGCTPNPDWSHINVIYIQSVWQHLYTVDNYNDNDIDNDNDNDNDNNNDNDNDNVNNNDC
jgi:hypothetical protein